RDDVGRVDRPEVGELDAALLEVDRAVAPVGHDDVAALPRDLVVGVHAGSRVDPLEPQPLPAPAGLPPRRRAPLTVRATRRPAHRLRHEPSPDPVKYNAWVTAIRPRSAAFRLSCCCAFAPLVRRRPRVLVRCVEEVRRAPVSRAPGAAPGHGCPRTWPRA